MRKRIALLVIALLVLGATPLMADGGGIGLATPQTTSITISEFPFHHADQFRVYNNGDEDAVIVIYVFATYPDVREWVSLEKDILSIEAGTSAVCHFAIDAEEGYTGDYDIIFTPTKLAQGLTEVETEGGISATAYIGLGAEFKLALNVPQEVGSSSLGERPPMPEMTPEEATIVTEEQIAEVTEGGIVWEELVKPIVFNIPSSIVQGESVELSASFIGGGEPAQMGLLIVSPSGKKYELPRSTTFKFDEPGKWSIIVTIAGHAILGQTVEVTPREGIVSWVNDLFGLPLVAVIGGGVLIIVIIVLLVLLLRRRRDY